MSRNLIEKRKGVVGSRRLLGALVCCVAAVLGASGCDGDEPACSRPNDEPRGFIEVRDRDGACTECSAEGGLTLILGLANGCDNVARFTTPTMCLVRELTLVRDGEMFPVVTNCFPSVTDWEMQPGEDITIDVDWGHGRDQVSESWGPIEPGPARLVVTFNTDLTTDAELAPTVETEIVVTAP